MIQRKHPRLNLWWLVASPTAWSVHFLATYTTIAIACAKFGTHADTADAIRLAIAGYTAVALVLMTWIGKIGYQWHQLASQRHERHADDTTLGRAGFMGFATLLLTGLSMIATIFVALTAWFIGSCQ